MKYLILFLAMSATCEAKIIYVLNGVQQISDADGVTTSATVIWDEKKNGPIPNGINPLDYDNVDGSLVLNAQKKADREAREASQEIDRLDGITKRAEFDALKAKVFGETATAAEVRKLLKHVLRKLGE